MEIEKPIEKKIRILTNKKSNNNVKLHGNTENFKV